MSVQHVQIQFQPVHTFKCNALCCRLELRQEFSFVSKLMAGAKCVVVLAGWLALRLLTCRFMPEFFPATVQQVGRISLTRHEDDDDKQANRSGIMKKR